MAAIAIGRGDHDDAGRARDLSWGRVWVREIRKRTAAVLSTDYSGGTPRLAVAMFARWSEAKFLPLYAPALQFR